jgi:NAD-dependent SIR2 family protein deacetylase
MYKEGLFELIRNEEVVLWAGAGLSIYAGYPSGERLADLLYADLTGSERQAIKANLPLTNLADAIWQIKQSKHPLIKSLSKHISKNPHSFEYHKKLAQIPHIKTIITTNYDQLFEIAYGDNGQVLISSSSIPYIDKSKAQIFKAHGDFSEPDSIIIASQDYNRFFGEAIHENTYWTVIRERMATKCILFIGYNLEDPNVDVIFNKITKELKDHSRECFLIAPSLPQYKIDYLSQRNIKYIDSTGEAFIDELTINIKDHIVQDFQKGRVSADTFKNFLHHSGLSPSLQTINKEFALAAISGVGNELNGTLNLWLNPDDPINKLLKDFTSGKQLGSIEIPSEKLLKSCLKFGGIQVSQQFTRLRLMSAPIFSSNIDIRLKDGFEYSEVGCKIYAARNKRDIKLKLKNGDLDLLVHDIRKIKKGLKVTFNFQHHNVCGKTRDEVQLCTFLVKLASGEPYTVFINGINRYSNKLEFLKGDRSVWEFYLDYFQRLLFIENTFNIVFTNIKIDDINEESYQKAQWVEAVVNGDSIDMDLIEAIPFPITDRTAEGEQQILTLSQHLDQFEIRSMIREKITLHGQEFDLGYPVTKVYDPVIMDFDSFDIKSTSHIMIRSKSNKIAVLYVKDEKGQEGLINL